VRDHLARCFPEWEYEELVRAEGLEPGEFGRAAGASNRGWGLGTGAQARAASSRACQNPRLDSRADSNGTCARPRTPNTLGIRQANLVPGVGLEPALPLPEKGF